MDDLALIKQTLNGNTHAFRFLVLRYQKPIFKFLGGLIYDKQLVEDLAQETFLRAYRSLSSYDAQRGASFSTWLFTIAKNLSFNELEKNRHKKKHLDAVSTEMAVVVQRPDENAQMTEQKMKLREAVKQLPKDFRSAVILSYLDGHSIAEIAQIENVSEGTVKSRIFRGKQILRNLLLPLLGGPHEKPV